VKLSDKGAQFIANFEGFRATPYWDVNHWSSGHGTRARQGDKAITRTEAMRRLQRQADSTYGAAVNKLGVKLNQNQFDALTSFAYNLGPGVVSRDSMVGRLLRAGKYKEAADTMLAYDKAGGRTLAGLSARRRKERELFLRKPPVGYSDEERKYLARLKKPGKQPGAEKWLKQQAADIQRAARKDGKGGWEKHDRGRRYQGIRRAIKRYS
jgi:lysozyme